LKQQTQPGKTSLAIRNSQREAIIIAFARTRPFLCPYPPFLLSFRSKAKECCCLCLFVCHSAAQRRNLRLPLFLAFAFLLSHSQRSGGICFSFVLAFFGRFVICYKFCDAKPPSNFGHLRLPGFRLLFWVAVKSHYQIPFWPIDFQSMRIGLMTFHPDMLRDR
jgi:hypothetical protein